MLTTKTAAVPGRMKASKTVEQAAMVLAAAAAAVIALELLTWQWAAMERSLG
jgi:hypothetical protein